MLCSRGEWTVCISKVKGHAEEELVRQGQVRELDRDGNNRADQAADFGRRSVWPDVIDARRNLSGVCGRWYPVVGELHRFFIAVSRAVVNTDGSPGIAPNPLVWSAGGLPKRRRIVHAVRDAALLPGPAPIWDSGWVGFFPRLLLLMTLVIFCWSPGQAGSFLGTLRWPASGADLGVGGISCVELLILYV